MALTIHGGWLRAQIAEPILTKSAIPFAPGAGGIKLEYAGGLGSTGGGSEVIPEGTLEEGVTGGVEALLRFPLLRVHLSPGATVIGGGQLAIGARALIGGGARRAFAVSLQAVIETPTGNTRLVGDATQLMPTVLADWRPVSKVVVHANLTYDRSVGHTLSRASFLEFQNAITWRLTDRVVPVLELVSSTNTFSARTQLVTQPEVILRAGPHFEWKAGLQLGLTQAAPSLGLRIQFAAFWGKRE